MIKVSDITSKYRYVPETGKFYHIKTGMEAGAMESRGYRQIYVKGKRYMAHRLAWMIINGAFPENQIDHINRVRDDNRISNLREATPTQNSYNTKIRKDNTSGIRGVGWYPKYNKWRAYINDKGKNVTIGYFSDKTSAERAVMSKRKILHGEFLS